MGTTSDRPADGAPASYARRPGALLAEALTISAGAGDTTATLRQLAELAVEATDADRASFFLVDDGQRTVRLWAAAGRHPDLELWRAGEAMPPIPLEDVPARRRLLEASGPIAVEDAATSPVVPAEWTATFRLASLVIAPMRHQGELLGLLVTDYRKPRRLGAEVVDLVGAIAGASALAVSSLRLSRALADRAAALESLVDSTAALLSPRSLAEVTEEVAGALERVLGASHLSVHVLREDGRRFRTLIQRGVALPANGDVSDLPRWALVRVAGAWRRGRPRPVALAGFRERPAGRVAVPDSLGSVLALPLLGSGGGLFGFVLVGREHDGEPDPTTVAIADALAAHIALAFERARLGEQVGIGVEFARTLLAVNEVDTESPDLLRALDAQVPAALGFRVTGARLGGRWAPAAVSVRGGTPAERELWQRWRRRRRRPAMERVGNALYAPLWGTGRAVGYLAVAPTRDDLTADQRELVEALASAVGEAVEREHMRRTVRRRDHELAVARERTDMALDLRGTVARLLTTIEQSAADLTAGLDRPEQRREGEAVVRLARLTRRELGDTGALVGSLAGEPAGLVATLDRTVARLSQRLGAAGDVVVSGAPRPLESAVEQVLLRAVHEILDRVERNGRATAISVRVRFRDDAVALEIRDDGVDLATREAGEGAPAAHFGLRVVQRRVESVGGHVELHREAPRGLLFRVTVPA